MPTFENRESLASVRTKINDVIQNADTIGSHVLQAQAWAESPTAPGDPGTKSAKTWAEEAAALVTTAPFVTRTASFTLALTDLGVMQECDSASAIVVTVPTDAAVAFAVRSIIPLLRVGAGAVSVAGASGVTVNSAYGLNLASQWSGATLIKRATNVWVLQGDTF